MKGSKMKKRILAALLCTTMVLNTGMSAMADEGAAALTKSAHVHTESCYEKNKTDQLICTKAEAAEGHVHGDECYEVTSTPELTCTQEETAGHTHDDGCMKTTKNVICGKEEHTHGGDCYETETKDVCNDESEEHTCGDGCVKTEEVLACTVDEHIHDDGCYEVKTNIVCGQDEVEAHTHGEGCYTTVENKTLKCTLEEVEAHTHNDECYAWEEKLVCTIEEGKAAQETEAEDTQKPVETQKNDGVSDEEKSEKEPTEVNLQNDDETGIKVSVKSTSDVIPEDTKVVVASMEMDEEHEAALEEAVSEFEVLGYTAYDISLKDAEDEDITLGENKVEVAIDFEELIPEGINAEEVKDVVLVHITTDEEEKLTAETVGTVEITEEKATVEFEADSFSPYVVTYLSEAEEAVEEVVVEEPVEEDITLTYTSEDEAYTATVTAAPEVLENVTAFEAVPVTDEKKITALTEQLTAKAAEAQKTSLGFENYEFKFMDAEGNEAVVEGKVKVSLSFAEARLPEAATAENVDAVDAALLETAEEGLEEINGMLSAEAGAVKEVVYTTEEPEELILAWSGDVYRTLPNYEDDDVVITLAGTEYALQNVVGFNVTPIKEDNEETKEQYAEVAQQLEEKIAEDNEAKEEEKEVVGFLAYDITLVDAEGNEREPQGGVRVSMEYKEAAAPEAVAEAEEAEVTIHHFEEDEKGEVKQIVDMVAEEAIEAGVTTTEKAEVEKAEFVTEGFSVFAITWIRTGDNEFEFLTDIKVLVADGTNYRPMSDDATKVIKEIEVSSKGTPPTLYADSITENGKNKDLQKIKIVEGEQETTYQFVKIIVARETNENTIQAVHLDPVIAIQAMEEADPQNDLKTQYLGYMLDNRGFYFDARELAENEFLAFVYTRGVSTVTGTYWSENGVELSDKLPGGYSKTYDFSTQLGEDVVDVKGIPPKGAPQWIGEEKKGYIYQYIAIEHLGERIIPEKLRYISEGDTGTSKLQYCTETEEKIQDSEWVDVVDADVRLIYKAANTIETANTAGVVDIDLFNYNIGDTVGGNFGGFIQGLFFGTGDQSDEAGDKPNQNGEGRRLVYNQWTGGVKESEGGCANLAVQGMVAPELVNGYPKLADGVGTGGSLKALFDYTSNASDKYTKEVYPGLNHLFKKDGDYYKYDSSENYAYYNNWNGNKNFTVYSAHKTMVGGDESRGDFMPFIPITEENINQKSNEDAYHFGMRIGFDFVQPKGGLVNDQPMIFRFSGDDDVWVFIDGKLVLDLGGMHSETAGIIDFSTGKVQAIAGPKVGSNGVDPNTVQAIKMVDSNGIYLQTAADVVPGETTLDQVFDFSDGVTFKENTVHRLEFFYLERGADMTNCAITFNMQPVSVQEIKVGKEIVGTDNAEYGDVKFTYELYRERSIGSGIYDKIPEGTKYTVTRDGVDPKSRIVTANGQFVLKHGEVATFDNINSSCRYFVREIGVNENGMSSDEFSAVTVNGSPVTYYKNGQKVEVDSSASTQAPDGEYIAESIPVTPIIAQEILFQNTCAETNKQDLYIQKLFDKNTVKFLTGTESFKFKVMLEDRDGVMDLYKGGYELLDKDGNLVEKKEKSNGIISIKVDQMVIIKDLMVGTDFYVEEIELNYTKYQEPDKKVLKNDQFSCDESEKTLERETSVFVNADGAILAGKNAKVEITNALKFDWELIKVSSSDGVSGLSGAEFSLVADSTGETYTGISGENGKVIWSRNIPYGIYTLKETKAPQGYCSSTQTWTVEIGQIIKVNGVSAEVIDNSAEPTDENTFFTCIKKDDGTLRYTIKISNDPLYELPSTGGHGIYTTMLSGFALMMGAAYVWFTSKREEMLQ